MITLETNKERDGLGIAATLKVGDFACPIIEVTHDDLCAASPDSAWRLAIGNEGGSEFKVLACFLLPESEIVLCSRSTWDSFGQDEGLVFYNIKKRTWTEAS